MADLEKYLTEVSEPFRAFYLQNQVAFEQERAPTHPGKQKLPGGRLLHTLQVIEKALEWNQSFGRREIIEVCLVHDMKGCESLPLSPAQRLAIEATKGKATYKDWRPTPHYKFVVLILIADMWSAFINEKDL
jgi:hypothetical protein